MMKSYFVRRQLVLTLSVVLIISSALPLHVSHANQAPVARARLVLGIVIDQFRYDFLVRLGSQFGEGGFKRLLNGGAVFSNANYIHTPTYTACGHATFMTGTTPSMNGIVGNDWYDRETGKSVTSVGDDQTKLLGGREGVEGMSPRRLIGSTLGDELKLASNGRAKVIGMSYKDRAAILPAGKRPDAAYWFSSSTGGFVSSNYYFNDLPAWVKAFNQGQRADKYFGKKWEPILPGGSDQQWSPESSAKGFPYILNGGEEKPGVKFYDQFQASPFASDHLVNFAKSAIENEGLGADDITDLLTISFSANDLVGHSFGPYSPEVRDMTLRLDRTLADLFSYLDRKIGLNNVVIALTSDHGIAPVPEQVAAMGYGGRIDLAFIPRAIAAALNNRFGEEKWVVSFVNGNVYLDEGVIARHKLDLGEVESVASEAVSKVPGVTLAVTATQIKNGWLKSNPIIASVVNGFFLGRSGNLIVVPRPFFIMGTSLVANHGTPYSYDTHVPVILYGQGITPGIYRSVSSPADIAPTLSSLLGIETPSNAVGRILTEAIK
jgi:predicted AlkP superfamily pyrophosphatase or phosphodiesterase